MTVPATLIRCLRVRCIVDDQAGYAFSWLHTVGPQFARYDAPRHASTIFEEFFKGRMRVRPGRTIAFAVKLAPTRATQTALIIPIESVARWLMKSYRAGPMVYLVRTVGPTT